MLSEAQAHLLSICTIDRLNWHLIAREAQRPGGLNALLAGEISETCDAPLEMRMLLRDGLRRLPELLREAQERAAPATNVGAKLTTVLDEDYPLNLRKIFNLPPFLFYIGKLDADDVRSVAVVGTREATDQGLLRASRLASALAERKVTVVSGLARGIDTVAHQATLKARGRTMAVMGTGICHIYPPENKRLANEIVNSGGALVSQFWPTTPPATHTFPRRNVTMSGMTQGTVVIEASATSGAKLQARLALEHGKKVFLLKSLVQDHEWARKYLLRGAVQVDKVETILAQLTSPTDVRQQVQTATQLRLNLS